MALEMRVACERCQAQLDPRGDAYICSFECTFCPACTKAFDGACPNCGGELVRRPRQKAASSVESPNGSHTEAASTVTQCQIAS
jgi:hypothetical protein